MIDWAHIGSVVANRAQMTAKAIVSVESLTTVGGLVVVWIIEVIVMGWPKSSLYRLLRFSRSARTDVFWTILKILGLNGIILAALSLGLTVASTRAADKFFGFHVLDRVHNPALRCVLYLIGADFVGYWVHRGRHGFGWWWEFHKAHHSATEFNALTTNRGHPFDGVAIITASAVPLALLGGSIGDFVPWLTILAVHAGLTHSMLPWRWGWFGKYVIFPPMGHRVHHSPLPEHRDKNFGGVFPIWDHVFGTYYMGESINEDVGVDDNYQNSRGLWFDMVESTRRSIRTITRRGATK